MTPEQITAYTGIGTMIGLVVVGILNRLDARKAIKSAQEAAIASEKAEKVSTQIHTLVNSQLGNTLYTNMLQAKRIAEITKGTLTGVVDAAAAAEAERLYNVHQSKQAVVDASANKI